MRKTISQPCPPCPIELDDAPTKVAASNDVLAANRGSPHIAPGALPPWPRGAMICTDASLRRTQITWVPETSYAELDGALAELGAAPERVTKVCGPLAPDVSNAPALRSRINDLSVTTKHLRDLLAVSEQQLEIALSDAHGMVKGTEKVLRIAVERDPAVASSFARVFRYGAEHAGLTLTGRERAKRLREEEKKAREREAAKANTPDPAPAKEGAAKEGSAKEAPAKEG